MDCPRCGAETVAFPADEYAFALPEGESRAALCSQCLSLGPVADPDGTDNTAPAFERVSERFPSGQAAVPFALLVGRLEHLAVYRAEITALLETVERAGVDPLAALEGLERDPTVAPAVDLAARRRQLEQLV